MHVLIDNEKLKPIKLHEDPVALLYWAEILIPTHDYRICETFPECYKCYTDLELRWIYYNSVGVVTPAKVDGSFDRHHLLNEVEFAIDTQEPDVTTVEELRIKLGKTLEETKLINLKI